MRPNAQQSGGLLGLPVGAGAVALAPAKAGATPKPGKGYGLNHERPRVKIFASAKIQQPKTKDQRQKHRSPLGIAGGRYAPTAFLPPGIAGSFRGYAPRLEHQGPGFALKSSPVQTRCAPLAAASGFTLDPQTSPGTPPRSLAWQTGQTAGLSGRESARFVIAKYYVLRVRYSYLFATLTSENA